MSIVIRLLAASVLVLPLACATGGSVTVEGVEPALDDLGTTRHLVLLETVGRNSARRAIHRQVARQARATGYFTVQDRTREGHTVQVVGQRVDLDGGRRKMPRGQAGLRVAVLEWRSHREAQAVTREADDGDRYTEVVPFRHASVVLEVSLFDETGRALVAQQEFEGFAEGEVSRLSRDIVLERAAREAVARFLEDVTPRWVKREVPLDTEDPGQAAIIEAANAGSISSAASAATRYVQQSPNNASAAYNLAVLLDALGDYEQALTLYDRALRLGGKEFYAEPRASCARRLAAREALASGPMPASLAPRGR